MLPHRPFGWGSRFGRLSAGPAVLGRSAAFPVPRYPQAMACINGTLPLPGSNSGSAGPQRQAPAVRSTEPVSKAGKRHIAADTLGLRAVVILVALARQSVTRSA